MQGQVNKQQQKKGLVVLIKFTPIIIVTCGLIFRCLKCKHVVRKVVVSQIQHVLSKYIGIRLIFCVYLTKKKKNLSFWIKLLNIIKIT